MKFDEQLYVFIDESSSLLMYVGLFRPNKVGQTPCVASLFYLEKGCPTLSLIIDY